MTEIKKTKRNKTPTLVLLPLLLFLFVMLYMVVSTLKGVAVDPTMSADSGSGSTSVTSNEEEPTIPEDQNNQKNPEPSTTTKAAPSLAQMQQQFQQARTDLIAKFQSEDYYGSYFETLFQDMDTQFLSSPSTQKLQRRLEYKLWHVLRKDSTTPKFVWTQGVRTYIYICTMRLGVLYIQSTTHINLPLTGTFFRCRTWQLYV